MGCYLGGIGGRLHRTGPPQYTVPLTGLDADGQAVTVDAPPGRIKRVRSGSTIAVRVATSRVGMTERVVVRKRRR